MTVLEIIQSRVPEEIRNDLSIESLLALEMELNYPFRSEETISNEEKNKIAVLCAIKLCDFQILKVSEQVKSIEAGGIKTEFVDRLKYYQTVRASFQKELEKTEKKLGERDLDVPRVGWEKA